MTDVMEVNGFKAQIMKAPKLKNIGRPNALPPGEPLPVYPIESLPGAPEDWLRENGSYVVPVSPDEGLWFNWTMNDWMNTAIVPSVKGMNPITGRQMEGVHLEAYVEKCPKHDVPFQNGRVCPKCGYAWPMQNWISSPNTLWWDGFRQDDGKVRQFFFSADEAKDIASLVIGKQNTVPAFGFAFYKPKNPRAGYMNNHYHYYTTNYSTGCLGGSIAPAIYTSNYGGTECISTKDYSVTCNNASGESLSFNSDLDASFCDESPKRSLKKSDKRSKSPLRGVTTCSVGPVGPTGAMGAVGPMGPAGTTGTVGTGGISGVAGATGQRVYTPEQLENASVSVGAGAEISQNLAACDIGIGGWQEKHSGIMRIYFCFKPQFDAIYKKGYKPQDKKAEGFMSGLPVGG